MADCISPVRTDLRFKHSLMTQSAFGFFRGTYYRWVQLSSGIRGLRSPQVLGIGDLHVENFGTWRDAEGRLIWGVNDFDEAYPQPYILDLLRLTASAHLAARAEHLRLRPRHASELIWEGYIHTLKSGGSPFVLEEDNTFLREVALSELRDPVQFWKRIQLLPNCHRFIPHPVRLALTRSLPTTALPLQFKSRRAGAGSLGRERFVALARWQGSLVAREAKAVLPSAYGWAKGSDGPHTWISQIVSRAVRVPDPYLQIEAGWIIRRLSPHCSRIELSSLPLERDEERLLYAMGSETANIHLGSRNAVKRLLQDVEKRTVRFLHESAKAMVKLTVQDWVTWKKTRRV
jgi:hypothetical protein